MEIGEDAARIVSKGAQSPAAENAKAPLAAVDVYLRVIEALKPNLFVDHIGRERISLPIGGGQPVTYPICSRQTQAWISALVWGKFHIALRQWEVNSIVRVLEGKALESLRSDIDLESAMDADPLLEATVVLMREQSLYEKNCTSLLFDLGRVARAESLDVRDRLWPKGASQLSSRLRELTPMLATANIIVEIGRKNGQRRFVRLTRQGEPDAGGEAQSPIESFGNPKNDCELRPVDDSDAERRRMRFDRVRCTSKEMNDG